MPEPEGQELQDKLVTIWYVMDQYQRDVEQWHDQKRKLKEKKEYLEAAENEWAFIRDHVIDKRSGSEWFWEVDPEGNPYPGRPIVEPWKCPYHNGRMCMEVMKRC